MLLKPDDIQAVFFDLDGTLRVNDPPAMETFYRIAAELGFDTDEQTRIAGERWVNEYWADSDLYKEDSERFGHHRDNHEFWSNHAWRHLRQIGADEQLAGSIAGVLTERMRSEYQPRDHVPAAVFPLLSMLKDAGYPLGLVSNRSLPMNDLVDELKLSQYFELILAAGEVGWFKPDPRLLSYAAEQLGVDPAASVYIGDNYHADVLGARAAGMTPVLVDPRGIYQDADCTVISDVAELEVWFLTVSVGAD